MNDDVYKQAVLRVLPAAPEFPLEAPPTESFDMLNVETCPACGQSDAIIQEVEDARVAKCPHCQCEFSPRMESVTRKVIRRISEHRQRRLAERLPLNPPVAGLNTTDYALFRKIVDRTSRVQKHTQIQNVTNPDEETHRRMGLGKYVDQYEQA